MNIFEKLMKSELVYFESEKLIKFDYIIQSAGIAHDFRIPGFNDMIIFQQNSLK